MKDEKIILGVCAWLARRFNLSLTGLRIVFAVTCLLGLRLFVWDILPLAIYVALYLIMPKNQL